jgi:putative transposase
MRLVEQHIIKQGDPRFARLDAAAFASKNLFNAANYCIRQSFLFEHVYLDNIKVFHQIKSHEAYQALPRKVSNQVLMQLHTAWKAFFEAREEWKQHPEKFVGRPNLPKYKHKTEGRNVLVYEWKAVSKRALKRGMISLTGLGDLVKTKVTRAALYQVRIIPKGTHYFLEVVYERPETQAAVSSSLFASLDLGVTNLAAITSNKPGFVPLLVNGRVLKSINQGYNKGREHLQKQLAKQDRLTSRRIKAITDKRNRRIQYQLHKASRVILDLLVDKGSYNIARKVFSTAFDGPEIEAPAVRPIRLAVK